MAGGIFLVRWWYILRYFIIDLLLSSVNFIRSRCRVWNNSRVSFLASVSYKNVRFGSGCIVRRFAYLKPRFSGSMKLGNHCTIGDNVSVSLRGDFNVGNHCSIGRLSTIEGHGNISLGDGVRIGPACGFYSANHVFEKLGVPIHRQGMRAVGITIGADCWIGGGTIVLDGSSIGKGCIIGAGSVVKGSLEPYSIYAGVPVKYIRARACEKGEGELP